MTDLFVVPNLPDNDDDGTQPPFTELMLIAKRLMESALHKIEWADTVLPLAKHLVTDPEDANVIAKLAERAIVTVSFEGYDL